MFKITFYKSILVLIAFVTGLSFANAQQLEVLNENGNPTNDFQLHSSSKSNISLTFHLNSYWTNEVETPRGVQKIVNAMGSSRLLEKGAPDLPKFSTSLILPDNSKMEVDIANSDYIEIQDIDIAPSKGNLLRNVDPDDVDYTYGKVYQENKFFPRSMAELNKPYIVRDFRGAALWVYPVQYNPVTRVLRIYTTIEIKVSDTGKPGVNPLSAAATPDRINREFNEIYKNQFINYDAAKYDPVTEEGSMLIICHDDWTDEMQDFVDWKNTIGRPTEMVTVTEAGETVDAISSYVEDYYTNNDLAHLLLVGDAEQVPTNSGTGLGGDSDNAYAYISGDDHYLEFFVGRFSAESADEVTTQAERMIAYENGSELTSEWLNRTMGVTSSQGGSGQGDDDEIDYEHYRNLATDLLDFTYTESLELFDGSQGGNDASGDPTPDMVASDVNDGVGVINYTGHGSTTSWGSSGFSVSDVNALTNNGMLPFIWSVACVNGNFVGGTCFGESWLRATNDDAPAGAIGIMASTINQSWAPPMAAQDEMVDIMVESYDDNIKRTFGGLSINGCHLMNDEYQDYDMTDTWTLFGDPSLLVRTADAEEMTVSYNGALLIGQESFQVTSDTEGALVSLTVDGEIMGTATVTDGVANVTFDAPTTPGEMKVAVTGFNKITHIGTVEITPDDEPYVVMSGKAIDDTGGNGNGLADYGESVMLDITLENVAEEGSGFDASDVNVSVSTNDSLVSFTDNTETFGEIAAGESKEITGAFAIQLADSIPDQHTITCDLEITGSDKDNYTWSSTMVIKANAPVFEIGSMSLSNDDDDNGRLDPGETADLTFEVCNMGHAAAEDVINCLSAENPYLTIFQPSDTSAVNAQDTSDIVFNVAASDGVPQGTPVELMLKSAQGVYTDSAVKNFVIGQPPEIAVGDGSQESGNYPFYTYYENNKSQMLYLGSEIGSGEMNIQEMAFDFTTIGAISELQNLSIRFLKTEATELGGEYMADSGMTEVFADSIYAMPGSAGWHTFDIDDYTINVSDYNLLVEITWGDNGDWESPEYILASTSTDFTSVVYGYADSETPPDYDGEASARPNLKLFFEGEAPGDEYTATFVVNGESGALSNATVTVGTMPQETDDSGMTMFDLYEGDYYYSAEAPGHIAINNQMFTLDESKEIEINMQPDAIRTITAGELKLYPNPTNGVFTIELPEGNTQAIMTIMDLTGKVIHSQVCTAARSTLDLTHAAKGIYIVKMMKEDKIYLDKVIIE